MPVIRYVCLSDLHLGADNSILTAIKPGSIETDPSRPSAVLGQFALCLWELLARDPGLGNDRTADASKPFMISASPRLHG